MACPLGLQGIVNQTGADYWESEGVLMGECNVTGCL
jgi:hypothetical protein